MRKLYMTIIIAQLLALVLLLGTITTLDESLVFFQLLFIPIFAVLLLLSFVTTSKRFIVSATLFTIALLANVVYSVLHTVTVYDVGLGIIGIYLLLALIYAAGTVQQKSEQEVLVEPIRSEVVPIMPPKKVAQKKTAKKVTKKSVKKPVTKKVVKKSTKKSSKKAVKKSLKRPTSKKVTKKQTRTK
ncbi:MAG: hypothetical protein ACMXYA_02290, partial [Candidatus Woesearchaeota archaeon]